MAACTNSQAKREVLGELQATLVANHNATLALAQRADADIKSHDDAWRAAHDSLREGCSSMEDSSTNAPAHAALTNGAAPQPALEAAEADASWRAGAAPALAEVTELQWLRLETTLRGSLSRDELNSFWQLLHGLFLRKEVRRASAHKAHNLGRPQPTWAAHNPQLGPPTTWAEFLFCRHD